MKTKSMPIELKAVDANGVGTFQAYASVFDNIDSYGDVVRAGAFLESLAEYGAKGEGIPLYWRHRMDDPFMNLGQTLEAKEDDHGLWVECQMDLDNATAAYSHKLLKEGRAAQMSFAYDILEGGWVTETVDGVEVSYYELRKLRIHEVSIVPVGANQETEILAVKSAVDAVVAGVKAGRPLSPDDIGDAKAALAELGAVIPTDQEQVDATSDAKAEEPSGAKAEEPSDVPHARAKAVNQLVQTL